MVGFLALAIVAGFASQAFTERLLLAVNVLFGGDFEMESEETTAQRKRSKRAKNSAQKIQLKFRKISLKKLDELDSAPPSDPDNIAIKKGY